MLQEKQNSKKEKQSKELKEFKRKNKRMNAMLLIGLFQIGSLALSYYLGHTSQKKK